MTEKYAWEGKGLDESAARELHLWIENDSNIYRQQYEPILRNLTLKKARGVYDHAKAVKLFEYLTETGAKHYYAVNEEGWNGNHAFPPHVGAGWHEMFPTNVRHAVAEELANHFEAEHDLGNYSNYLPKKYQPKYAVSKTRKTKKTRRAPTATSLGSVRR